MKWWEWILGFFMVGLISWIVTMRYQPTMEFEDRCGPDKQEIRQCVSPDMGYGGDSNTETGYTAQEKPE